MRWQESELGRVVALPAVALLAAGLLLSSLTAFGIWDPWELQVADRARALAAGQAAAEHDPTAQLVALGFKLFGVSEWSGRLPGALCGLAIVGLAYVLGAGFGGTRVGLYAALVTATTPLFILNAVPMGGQILGFLLQTLVLVAGARALFADTTKRLRRLWLLAAVGASAGAIALYGALLGLLPALLALSATALLSLQPHEDQEPAADRTPMAAAPEPVADRAATTALVTITAVITVIVIFAIATDSPGYSPWTGGKPLSRTPPTFDAVLEQLFHGLAPWSAMLPLALTLPFAPTHPRSRRMPGVLCALWCVAGYGSQTLYLARYGATASFFPVAGAGFLVANFLRSAEEDDAGWPAAAVVVTFLCGLLIRDYALYPESPLAGLATSGLTVPEAFNPKVGWVVVLMLFATTALLSFAARQAHSSIDLAGPYRLLRSQWRRGGGFRVWLALLAIALVASLSISAIAWVLPDTLRLTTLGRRLARQLGLVLLALPPAVAGVQALWRLYGRIVQVRFLPVAAAGACVGLFVAHGFLPNLSGHLSPREVYRTFNRVAAEGEQLAEYRVGGGAAAYYAKGEVLHFGAPSKFNQYLAEEGRRWAAVRAQDLPAMDSRFRKNRGRHLFVLDTGNASIALASTEPIPGYKNRNPLLDAVLDAPPKEIQHPVHAVFDDKIELLGYDLDSRHAGYVGAGESFTLTWYVRALKPIPSDYSVFVHIDGRGKRIHGDHEPVRDLYPMHLWAPGDVIADRHEVDVRVSAAVGKYTVLMGFYRGDKRLPVVEGPNDGEDRVQVGVLRIR